MHQTTHFLFVSSKGRSELPQSRNERLIWTDLNIRAQERLDTMLVLSVIHKKYCLRWGHNSIREED